MPGQSLQIAKTSVDFIEQILQPVGAGFIDC